MTNNRQNDFDVPRIVLNGQQVRELARIWAVDGEQVVVFNKNLWSDPAAWGIFLADFAKHIAKTYGEESEPKSKKVLNRIIEGFEAEINHPTE